VIENEFAKAGVNVSGMMLLGAALVGTRSRTAIGFPSLSRPGNTASRKGADFILAIQRIFAKKLISVDIMVKTQERTKRSATMPGSWYKRFWPRPYRYEQGIRSSLVATRAKATLKLRLTKQNEQSVWPKVSRI